jgi:hypothetical protein
VAIAEGAHFRGSVDMQRKAGAPQPQTAKSGTPQAADKPQPTAQTAGAPQRVGA